jgi:hypothetical protein
MENNTIRIRTDINTENSYRLNFKLEQDFDFFEVLSLKLRQDDLYKLFCSDYGVVIGRVIANGGLGVPNAKISIFIPIDEIDKQNPDIYGLYPYENINDRIFSGQRYNLLPKTKSYDCYTPVGSFPNKRQVLDNDIVLDIYQKYYKYTTVTNQSGDYMLFGVPNGTWKINIDVDIQNFEKWFDGRKF